MRGEAAGVELAHVEGERRRDAAGAGVTDLRSQTSVSLESKLPSCPLARGARSRWQL